MIFVVMLLHINAFMWFGVFAQDRGMLRCRIISRMATLLDTAEAYEAAIDAYNQEMRMQVVRGVAAFLLLALFVVLAMIDVY